MWLTIRYKQCALFRYRLPLAQTRTTTRVTKKSPHSTENVSNTMASYSNKAAQVRPKPTSLILYPFPACYPCSYNFLACYVQLTNMKTHAPYMPYKKLKYATNGPTLQYEIIREANWPPISMKQTSKTNLLLTLNYVVKLTVQDHDQDMADSSSPTNNKRG
jgi:hypothetical protein